MAPAHFSPVMHYIKWMSELSGCELSNHAHVENIHDDLNYDYANFWFNIMLTLHTSQALFCFTVVNNQLILYIPIRLLTALALGYSCNPTINPSHKSHNALDKYPRMHHFVTEMCTNVHISVTKWCIMKYQIGELWDICNEFIADEQTLKNMCE